MSVAQDIDVGFSERSGDTRVVPRATAPEKKLGRPPDTDSARTRESILTVAREEFAVRGYDVTTNRSIASLVGITSGALYHYFESKLDLYLAVYREVQREILEVLTTAASSETTFEKRFAAILDATLDMNQQDPSAGRFNAAVRVDLRRHPDIAAAVRTNGDPIETFFAHLIREGADSGEIRKRDVPVIGAFIRTVLLGITAGLSDDPDFQATANDGVKRAFSGLLVR